MFCSNCGTEIADGVTFCPNCGTKIEREEDPNPLAAPAADALDETIKEPETVSKPEEDDSLAKIREEIKGIWPDWKIESVIGHGSFGVVYKAKKEELGAMITSAIKVIHIPQNEAELSNLRSEMGLDEKASTIYFKGLVDDCVSEIKLMESLKSAPNVVNIEDYKVKAGDRPSTWVIYIRMELLDNFETYSKDKAFTEAEVVQLGIDVCSALESCAKMNVMHRDIKPENIFKSELGGYKLGDFGIARKLESSSAGMSKKGTYNYMAPEIYNGNTEYDARSDIYSLGIVLYKLMNHNRFPFLDAKAESVSYKDVLSSLEARMKGQTLPKPADAGEAFSEVILTACDPNPENRFATATAFKNALTSVKLMLENGTGDIDFGATVGVGSKKGTGAVVTNAPVEMGAVVNQPSDLTSSQVEPENLAWQQPSKPAPKKGKGKLALILVLLVLILIGAGGGFLYYKWYTSPKQQLMRALEKDDDDKVSEILDENPELADNTAVTDNLSDRIKKVRNDFQMEEMEYAEAKRELESIQGMNVSGVATELNDAFDYVERINTSRIHFNTGEQFMNSKDYPNAISEYKQVIEDDLNYNLATEQIKSCTNLFREDSLRKAKAQADAEDYQGAVDVLESALFTLPNDADLSQQLIIYQSALEAKKRSDVFAAADAYASKKQYLEAMNLMDDYLSANASDAEAKSKRQKYYDSYVDYALSQANDKVSAGDYAGAIKVLNSALDNASGERKITDKISEIEDIHVQQIIEESKVIFVEKGIPEAIALLEDGLRQYKGNEQLQETLDAYREQHVLNFLAAADEKMNAGDFEGAEDVVNEALGYYPSEQRLKDKLAEIAAKKPVSFKSINVVNGGFEWNEGVPEDPFGNDYSYAGDYIIFTYDSRDNMDVDREKIGQYYCNMNAQYCEVRLYGEYKSLSGTLAPYTSISTNGYGYVKIYADDKLVYTSKTIKRKTDAFDFKVDLKGVEYLKIVLCVTDDYLYEYGSLTGALIISNLMLYPN